MADLRCYLTSAGIAAENNAKQFGTTLKITEMVFDGTYLGDEQNPENLTEVINPVLTVPCSSTLSDDEQTLTFKGSILVEQGGFNVWGIGLKTDSGVLYGYARSKGDKILTEDEGATESVRYAVDIITKNSEVIEINVNPSTVYADLEDVDNAVKAGIEEHEAKDNPHSQYAKRNELLRALAFTPVFNAGVGYVPNPNFVAPSVGQKCYVSEYETAWALIQNFTNLIDEAIKAASITDGSKTYAGYWGTGSDENGDYFTTPNAPEFMHYKAAGSYGAAGEFKEDSLREHSHVLRRIWSTSTGANEDGGAGTQILKSVAKEQDYSSADYSSFGIALSKGGGGNGTMSDAILKAGDDITDTMGAFLDSFIWLPKGVF